MPLGILCLQGDFEAHGRALEQLGQEWRDVRRPDELDGLQGLVLPGGESTTMWHFLGQTGFDHALRAFAQTGGAILGTCAGAILLAREVENPSGPGLGVLDITIERNSYGRQTESSVRDVRLLDPNEPTMRGVLIRAPRILRLGHGVRARAWVDDDPAWVEQGVVSATTFHPELLGELRIHQRFLEHAASAPSFSSMVLRR